MIKRLLKFVLYIFAIFFVVIVSSIIYIIYFVKIDEPQNLKCNIQNDTIYEENDFLRLKNNWLHKNKYGLYEAYVEGEPYERGVALSKLEKDLMYFQESVFINQINELVPSKNYLSFLKHLILFFNRDLPEYVPNEYKEEILGTTLENTHEYDFIGTPYERQLNYHAAHDLGHAMQDYMLVGCSSFGTWGSATSDSSIIIGRNFDFYMGDDFAKNKIVTFYNPSAGYKFAMIGWAGMTGVVSGMNMEGLTITLNAAKSDMPTSSATPISILARKILQYASNIEEAFRIADTTKTFVSESLLIGSKKDNKVVIIEKSTEKTILYESNDNFIICTNHYQSKEFENDERNKENILTSDSPYRFERANELLSQNFPLDYKKAISILRNTKGLKDKNIGLGNEKALNQLIAHHSVVFDATHLRMWVSTSPWQLGNFVAYDLNDVFNNINRTTEVCDENLLVEADSLVYTKEFENFLKYRELKKIIHKEISLNKQISEDSLSLLISYNPCFFEAYDIVGDAYFSLNKLDLAKKYWTLSLNLEIPKQAERDNIKKKLESLDNSN